MNAMVLRFAQVGTLLGTAAESSRNGDWLTTAVTALVFFTGALGILLAFKA